MFAIELSDDIRQARRNLEELDGYELLEDFFWDSSKEVWALKFRITIATASAFIPESTDWYLLVSPVYPRGRIDIYPASDRGIIYTFQHQSYNELIVGAKWRTGNICVSTSVGLWGKKYFNKEPYDVASRLNWHMMRCKDWLMAAANDNLAVNGDPFEMPSFKKNGKYLFAFNEDAKTFNQWQLSPGNSGTFSAKEVFGNQQIFPINFYNPEGQEINYDWGTAINQSKATSLTGLWIMLNRIPVMRPWQMPTTWGQLFDICREQGFDLKAMLEKKIFKGNKLLYHFLLLGCPIPENIGQEPCRIFWLAISLPAIMKFSGFRKDTPDLKTMWFKVMFKDDASINWCDTENWSKNEIMARGKVQPAISNLKFVIVGTGAIGSCLSEMFLRLGCDNVTLIDDDLLAVGNLCRHTLTIDKTRTYKAIATADRLNLISPSAKIKAITNALDYRMNQHALAKIVGENDIFIDATGDDSLIHFISDLLSRSETKFISISAGFAAKRLFCFMADASQIQIDRAFFDYINPWLEKDAVENPDPTFPREGIGCWHPVFPARMDDIYMLVSTSLKVIERFLEGDNSCEFVVLEKDTDDKGYIKGINIISS